MMDILQIALGKAKYGSPYCLTGDHKFCDAHKGTKEVRCGGS